MWVSCDHLHDSFLLYLFSLSLPLCSHHYYAAQHSMYIHLLSNGTREPISRLIWHLDDKRNSLRARGNRRGREREREREREWKEKEAKGALFSTNFQLHLPHWALFLESLICSWRFVETTWKNLNHRRLRLQQWQNNASLCGWPAWRSSKDAPRGIHSLSLSLSLSLFRMSHQGTLYIIEHPHVQVIIFARCQTSALLWCVSLFLWGLCAASVHYARC